MQNFNHQIKLSFNFECLSLVENIWPPHLKWKEQTFHGHESDSNVEEIIESGEARGIIDMVVVEVMCNIPSGYYEFN